ncbi:hypothetical protein [Polaribacter aquimarinus]|uniref:PrcB C-terminal domain-containing protein n=1 Tax=Polaribacter aquimarinus TaxID=2100726 RepID=A0A2U2J6W3_9FLAO|nr:hypothetical protein [Polaribacter aquimarinus]PWG04021.1 hypothetical protein DIS07_14940 [Polaribacter aquimarinus]
MKKIGLILLIIFSCSEPQTETESFPITVEFREVGKGSLSGTGLENIEKQNIVINEKVEWENLITKMNSFYNQYNFEEVDFEKETIIGIILETQDGASVEIKEVIEESENFTVKFETMTFQTLVETQPYHIITIPKTEKKITFE